MVNGLSSKLAIWRSTSFRRGSLPAGRRRANRPHLETLERRDLLSSNLIVNGDFERGNTGFTSGYTYSPGDIGAGGTYDVVTNPNVSHGFIPPFPGDHTTDHGLMLAAKGSGGPTVPVWSVVSNSNYVLSLWVANWALRPPATLDIRLNGISDGTPTAPSAAGVWQAFSTPWASGSATSVTITIIDTQTAENGFSLR
jgi:hypothetical protein